MKPLNPGEKTPISGQYAVVSPSGKKTGDEITSVKDHTLPPTPHKNQGYVLVDPTKHKK